MIRSFRHKGLKELFEKGRSAKVPANLRDRVLELMRLLDAARSSRDLTLPGLRVHPWKGGSDRWSMDVNGPWRLTWEWDDGQAEKVDLQQPH